MPNKPIKVATLQDPSKNSVKNRALDWAAGFFSAVWLLGVGLYVWSGLSPAGVIGMAMTALVVVAPLALAWFTVLTVKSIRSLRAEAARLQGTVDAMRVSYASAQQQTLAAAAMRGAGRPAGSVAGSVASPVAGSVAAPFAGTLAERSADETASSEASVPFSSRRDGGLTEPSADRKSAMLPPRPALPGEEQPGLALGTPIDDQQAPLSMQDFLRAIHFPEGPEDKAGFQALRLALTDRTSAKLIRAAQDVLTLLAQEGIYMDDLSPDRARPELWRQFAAGERGRTIAGLGGVRDRSCLSLTATRMREDAVFRDAAHHFLRSFDKAIAAMEPHASDAELSTLSDTRTARAFMLFGRVTGTFD